MRKYVNNVLIAFILTAIFTLSGCGKSEPSSSVDTSTNPSESISDDSVLETKLEVVVLLVNENSLFVYNNDSEESYDFFYVVLDENTKILDKDDKPISLDKVEVKQMIEVKYTDVLIQEKYPPNYLNIKSIKLIGKENKELYDLGIKNSSDYINVD